MKIRLNLKVNLSLRVDGDDMKIAIKCTKNWGPVGPNFYVPVEENYSFLHRE